MRRSTGPTSNGGAIALGHPIGATGTRLMTTLLHELERTRRPVRPADDVRGRRPGQRDDHRASLDARPKSGWRRSVRRAPWSGGHDRARSRGRRPDGALRRPRERGERGRRPVVPPTTVRSVEDLLRYGWDLEPGRLFVAVEDGRVMASAPSTPPTGTTVTWPGSRSPSAPSVAGRASARDARARPRGGPRMGRTKHGADAWEGSPGVGFASSTATRRGRRRSIDGSTSTSCPWTRSR